ncbi:MAG: ABC transporter ATP-binding protein [bacterium]|nr:ABC transporter ATP-binding protein [Candidatus Sumerlaeota bacterium]
MLTMENVTKQYTRRRHEIIGLRNANLRIDNGEFVAIVGPSGSGKSTLLLMLGGMLSPSSGRVCVDGQSIYDLSVNGRAALRKQKIGFVFQTFNLVPYLSALQNVQVPLYLAGLVDGQQTGIATRLLERVGLGDRLDHKPSELSVGQQQRVALARMLANDPKIILADEPTGNLDPETGSNILEFFAELNAEGRTVVMVTHDARAAAVRATRTMRIVDGSIQPHNAQELLSPLPQLQPAMQ